MNGRKSPTTSRTLSVLILADDSCPELAASLASVQPIADRVIVLDTGSTGQAAGVARQYGAEVCSIPSPEDRAAVRNRGLAGVGNGWVLWLEVGETLEISSAFELRRFIDQAATATSVYRLIVESAAARQGDSAEQAAQFRLMPCRHDLQYQGRVRESLRASIEAAGLRISDAPGRIVRPVCPPSADRVRARAQQTLDLAARETPQQPEDRPRLLLALGEAHETLGQMTPARHAYRQAIATASRGSLEMLEAYYGLLGSLDTPDDLPERLSTCLEALEVFPLDGQLLLTMGGCLQARGNLDLACRSFEAAHRFGGVNPEAWHLQEWAVVAASCQAACLELQHRPREADAVLNEALTRFPASERIARRLLDLVVAQGNQERALGIAERLPAPAGLRDAQRDAVRGACHSAVGDATAALGYLQSAYLQGNRDPFCLRWLVVTLLGRGQVTAAKPVLDEWLQRAPENLEAKAYREMLMAQAGWGSRTETLPDGRRLRWDPGTTILATPLISPIVAQAHS